MARMYPPELLEGSVKSRAEIQVYEALRDDLPDEWEVFHSASFIVRDHATGADDDEVDFVLVHPDRAIVCLEVKGGAFECRDGEFFRRKDGKTERMRDPFEQALNHRYNFRRLLDDHRKGAGRDTFLVQGLAFPDVNIHSLVLAPDAPHEIVIDAREMRDGMAKAIDGLLAYHEGSREKRKAPGPEVAKLVRDILTPTVVVEITLGAEIDGEMQRVVRLDEQQKELLNNFARVQRVDVTGMPGSGKTLLAIEHAKRRARMGRTVLYVCFNRMLADDLNRRIAEPGLRIATFHKVCTDAAHRAGIPLTWDGKAGAPSEYFEVELPQALVTATERVGALFDDIIIDEAQDFSDDYLIALSYTVRNDDTAHIWVFRDDNQRVFDTHFTALSGYSPVDLNVNYRNTKAIHSELVVMYEGGLAPESKGAEGRPVVHIPTTDEARAVGGVILGLLERDDVEPKDIVVLSAHPLARSRVGQKAFDDFVFTTKAWGFKMPEGEIRPQIRFESVKAFKGLEAPVVVLCELGSIEDDEAREREMYVGMSRAQNHLVVVGPMATRHGSRSIPT